MKQGPFKKYAYFITPAPQFIPKVEFGVQRERGIHWKREKRNLTIQILFMLLTYRVDILSEPGKHGLDKTIEKQMESLLENWVHHLGFKEGCSLVWTSANWSRINQL